MDLTVRWASNLEREALEADDDSGSGTLFEFLDFQLHDFLNVFPVFHDRLLE
jgi:hypothetical protein